MPEYSQDERLIALETPLGKDVLLIAALKGREAISRPFVFQLDLLSTEGDIKPESLLGQNVTIRIMLFGRKERYINGYVSRFAQGGQAAKLISYQMEVVPWLWFLTRIADCRIFQHKTIPQIVEDVFKDRGYQDYKNSLTATYEKRTYCVQYRESDFNFVSRLMEEYGIYYFFEHEKGKHTLVMADSPSAHSSCPEQDTARYNLSRGDVNTEDVITGWQSEQELRSGKYSLTDYNFKTPSTSLLTSEPSVVNVGGNSKFELYDYPGDYLSPTQGRTVAKVRMQEQETGHSRARGESVCRAFATGYTFNFAEHFAQSVNAEYLLTEIEHSATVGDSYTTGESRGEQYTNRFVCMPAKSQFRPAQVTPRPYVRGPQTAVVVGKQGEEIWVDKYGRVKVQFYWDRQGKKDEKSSCWVRVSQAWAGKSWGAMWIPRIGQEVIVDFIEGDPDRPIITGRVYNAEQEVPYGLPDYNTRSTFQSRSSKGGSTPNYNEIRFEDKKGSEQIFVNAEKDMDHRVENDSREYIGANRHLIVNSSQFELVNADKHGHVKGKHNEKIDVDKSLTVGGNCMEQIGGSHSVQIGADRKEMVGGSDSRTVAGDVKEQVGGSMSLTLGGSEKHMIGGDVSHLVAGSIKEAVGSSFCREVAESSDHLSGMNYNVTAGMTINLEGGLSVNIEAGEGICLTGPGGFVSIGPEGVIIQGLMVLINSGGAPTPATAASPSAPDSPEMPATPDPPVAPTDPNTADDGSKGTKLK